MTSRSFAGGSVRVAFPNSYTATAARPGTARALPGEPGHATEVGKAAVLDSLRASGFDHVQSVDLSPKPTRDLTGPPPAATVQLDVDVPAGDEAVVLLERDGVFSWHLPATPAGPPAEPSARTRSERDLAPPPTPHTARFLIDLGQEAEAVAPGAPGAPAEPAPGGRRSRGLLGSLLRGAVQAIVLRFAVPPLVDKVIEHLEQDVQPGLVHLRTPDIATWERLDTLADLGLPTDRPVRLLLLIHGTFSSTVGSFGPFSFDENAAGFLATAQSAYDAVIGFDHKTLSVDPRANAKDLLERLSTHHPEQELVIDVVTHSRGGLTTRSLVEYELPESDWPGTVDHIVFVAATNAGTHLADPQRWHDLVDLYTNLVITGAGVLSAVPGAAPVAAVVGGTIKGIGALVKYLVSHVASDGGVPGLAAMMPDGPFVKALNGAQPGGPAPGTQWHVVSSNFHVSLLDDSHRPPEFARELVVKLAEGFVDRLFEGDNDLVVDTASMAAINLPQGGGYVVDSCDLGANDVVYHTNYFVQVRVIEALAGWLPLGLGAAPEMVGGEPPRPGPRPGDHDLAVAVPEEVATARQAAPRAVPPPPARHAVPPPAAPRAVPPPGAPSPDEGGPQIAGADGAGAPGPPAPLAEAHLAAEMPARSTVRQPFTVRVRLSRKQIAASPGTDSADLTLAVDPDRPVSVQVVGKGNATVQGLDRDIFELPPGGGTSELTFQVVPERKGKVRVNVIVRQGSVPLGTIELTGQALVGSVPQAAAAAVVSASASLGLDAPELEGLPCLEVVETEHGDRVVFEYALRLVKDGPVQHFTSPPLTDRAAFVGALMRQVEGLWVEVGDQPKRMLAELQDLGASLFEQLFPQEMQQVLWEHREDLPTMLLYADEPFLPWELVHLKPPVGPRQQKPRFLAQLGLVRWQFAGFPPKTLQARTGRVRSLVPDYLDPDYTLADAPAEAAFLADRFHATPVSATPTEVRKLLRSGDFDLLHFAGHGLANPADITDAKVLLRGRRKGDAIVPQYLSATNVSENATWVHDGSARPIVVLNACQAGRGGQQLSTLGGFATAFLRAGAGAFVSSLWSVGDGPARVFVEAFYDALLAGQPVATATVLARERARAEGDATWLAYAVYARPDAVLSGD